MLAQYRRGRDAGVLLLIDYPTPQLAELHAHHLETAIAETVNMAGTKNERTGALLSIGIGPSLPALADIFRAAGKLETQLTWEEPRPTASEPPLAGILFPRFFGPAA